MKMMSGYKSMRYRHLGKILVVKHHLSLKPSDASPILAIPHRVVSRQWQLEIEEIEKILKFRVAEPCTEEWAFPIGFGPKKKRRIWLSFDCRHWNTVTDRDNCPIS